MIEVVAHALARYSLLATDSPIAFALSHQTHLALIPPSSPVPVFQIPLP